MLPRWCVAAAVLLVPGSAHAANTQGYYLDGDAALAAGAVVATASGAGALYYDPAGLAGVDRTNVSVSVTAGVLQRRLYREALVARQPDGTARPLDLDGGRIGVAHPSIVYARAFGRVSIAGGIFTTRDDQLRVAGAATFTDRGRVAVAETALDRTELRYHFGGGVGFALSDRLRLGFALFGAYGTIDETGSLVVGSTDGTVSPAASSGLSYLARASTQLLGLQATVGAQYRATPHVSVGALLQGPIVHLHESFEAWEVIQVGSVGQVGTAAPPGLLATGYAPTTRDRFRLGVMAPPRLVLGVAYHFGALHVALEGDWTPGMRSLPVSSGSGTTWLLDQRTVVDARIAASVRVSDSLEVGGGLFSDRSGNQSPSTLGATDVSYFGASFGARRATSLALSSADTVTFRTTLAVRYALGFGRAGGVAVDLRDPAALGLYPTSGAEVRFHEVHVYLGSGIVY